MAEFRLSPEALDDLDAIHAFIAQHNCQVADQVLDAAFTTLDMLARTPLMGRSRSFSHPELGELRSFRVEHFSNYLIFYRPRKGGIEVVRVLHAARNLDDLFSGD